MDIDRIEDIILTTLSTCRMVEPLHSFVVMNTLALHLFLQPVTADLEFQDRNPFLLYKSGTGK